MSKLLVMQHCTHPVVSDSGFHVPDTVDKARKDDLEYGSNGEVLSIGLTLARPLDCQSVVS